MLKTCARPIGLLLALALTTGAHSQTLAQSASSAEVSEPASQSAEPVEPAELEADRAQTLKDAEGIIYSSDSTAESIAAAVATLEGLVAVDFPPAMVTLAGLHIDGEFVNQDLTRAEELLTRALDMGESFAAYRLAMLVRDDTPTRPADPARAAELLQRLASEGNVTSSRAYASMQFLGEGIPADPAAATERLEGLAEGGDPNAYLLLATLYIAGSDAVPADPQRAVGYLERAVEQDSRTAKRQLGEWLVEGESGVTPNATRGLALLQEAGDDGDRGAARAFATALIEGPEEIRDVAAGIAAYEALAADGDVSANLFLASLYLNGEVTPPDIPRGVGLLETAVAAGNTTAMTSLGKIYRNGADGLAPDAAASLALYRQAAEAGDRSAIIQAADMTIRGEGTAADAEAGIAQLEALGATGRPEPYAYLAEMFLSGDGRVSADPDKAVAYYQIAVDLDNATAIRTLGRLLLTGDHGVTPDPSRGLALLQSAADHGDNSARRLIASARVNGRGLAQDIDAGLAEYEALVAAGDIAGTIELASLYVSGEVGPAKPGRAVELLTIGVEQDNVTAINRLADWYRTGQPGVDQNLERAFSLYQQAADLGNTTAKRRIATMLLRGEGTTEDAARGLALLEETGAARDLATYHIRGEYVPQDVQLGISILETALANEDASAAQFLINGYSTGYGNRLPRRPDIADDLLEANRTWLPPNIYHSESAYLGAISRTRAGFQRAADSLVALDPSQAPAVFRRLRDIDQNAYVFAAQARLQELGLFGSAPNGLMDRSTIAAINALCEAEGRSNECRRGPLSRQAAVVISDALFGER